MNESRNQILAVDAMGGDQAPDMVIAGLEIAAARHPKAKFLVYGDIARLQPLLAKSRRVKSRVSLFHAAEVITGDMKPTAALRLRDSSLRRAIDAVQSGEASGVISAGNTGALLALSKIMLKTLPGIDRPAMAAISPSAKGDVVLLDLGANVVYDARNLVEFAVMGELFARVALGLPAPTVGLLNIGSEAGKGDEFLRTAAATLRDSPIGEQFHGFVEGHDIAGGTVDVVVTDGFTGNVALKTGEGALRLVSGLIKDVFNAGVFAKMGYLLARGGLKRLRDTLDPRRYNGAVFLGLNGVVVKSHGGADAEGFAHAIDVAMDMMTNDFNRRIRDGLAAMDQVVPPAIPFEAVPAPSLPKRGVSRPGLKPGNAGPGGPGAGAKQTGPRPGGPASRAPSPGASGPGGGPAALPIAARPTAPLPGVANPAAALPAAAHPVAPDGNDPIPASPALGIAADPLPEDGAPTPARPAGAAAR